MIRGTAYQILTSSACFGLSLSLLFSLTFPFWEARLVSAVGDITVAKQQVTAEISMTVASTTMVLLPAIAGLTGGTANASTSVNVFTNNGAGYTVTFQATSVGDAAMTGDSVAGKFNDYSATVPETWSDTSSGQASQYGFGITNSSLSSSNLASGYGTCATTEACWSKAGTTTPKTIVTVSTVTPPEGDNFVIKFRAHVPANVSPAVPEDWYTSTSTVTAIAL